MTLSPDNGKTPAPRTSGDIEAIQAAYRAGHIFMGKMNIPVIDLRHYLEDELDMHHVSASFSARLRMLRQQGHHENQLIWVAHKKFDPTAEALEAMSLWLETRGLETRRLETNEQDNQNTSSDKLSRPIHLQDRCYNKKGHIIANGSDVWDGEWNNRETGSCMQQYPIYSTSRVEAGDSLIGDIFKCQLMSVDNALDQGLYGEIDMKSHKKRLEKIFPDGVCDYSKPDQGLPNQDLFSIN